MGKNRSSYFGIVQLFGEINIFIRVKKNILFFKINLNFFKKYMLVVEIINIVKIDLF